MNKNNPEQSGLFNCYCRMIDMNEPTELIDKLALIYINDKKLLCTRSYGKDAWYIPGGKREAGETDQQTLAREIKEELNVAVDESTIAFYGIFRAQAHGKPEGVFVQMTCYTAELIGAIAATSEIEEIAYYGYTDDFVKSPADVLIFEDLHSKGLI